MFDANKNYNGKVFAGAINTIYSIGVVRFIAQQSTVPAHRLPITITFFDALQITNM